MGKPFMSIPEVSRLLGVSPGRCYALARERVFPSVHRGRRVIIPRGAFEKWVEQRASEALRGVKRKHRRPVRAEGRQAAAESIACTRPVA